MQIYINIPHAEAGGSTRPLQVLTGEEGRLAWPGRPTRLHVGVDALVGAERVVDVGSRGERVRRAHVQLPVKVVSSRLRPRAQ